MSYLRLIKNTMQNWAEIVASVLSVDVVIADKNFTRIVGTGDFYNRIDETCPEDSVFAKIIETGIPKINLVAKDGSDCLDCSNYNSCNEYSNMSYPLRMENQVIGVISFASFNSEQAYIMNLKKDEYFKMLEQTSKMITREISRVRMKNKLKSNITEIDAIINYIDKGIIFLNNKKQVIHINAELQL